MLFTVGLGLVLVIGGVINRRREPVLGRLALGLVGLGLLGFGCALLLDVDAALGVFYLAILSVGLGWVFAGIYVIGILRDERWSPSFVSPLPRYRPDRRRRPRRDLRSP